MENTRERLLELVEQSLRDGDMWNEAYQSRLALEMKDIDAQEEQDYFLDLYDKGLKYPRNQNNLLIPWALGIVTDFDISQPPEYAFSDWPTLTLIFCLKSATILKMSGHPNGSVRKMFVVLGIMPHLASSRL